MRAQLRSWLQRLYLAFSNMPQQSQQSGQDPLTADREIARNRVLVMSAATLYSTWLSLTERINDSSTFTANLSYLVVALWFLRLHLTGTRDRVVLRHLTLFLDVAVLSLSFFMAGEFAGPAFLLYIWVIIGYGFRYGIYFLRVATAASLFGFSTAIAFVAYWQTQSYLLVGLVGTLLIIPLYVELLLRRVLKATEQARDANHAKALMLAGIGHELRSPLASVLNSAQQLERTRLDSHQSDLVRSVETAVRALAHELDDFLDVSRIDAGRAPTALRSFNLHGIIKDAIEMLAGEARSAKLHLCWHISPQTPAEVRLDRGHLLKILTNLIGNALKFTAAGSVLVTVEAIESADRQTSLRFEVTDTGIGVEPEAREKIFESFTQANPAVLPAFGGAGLGLSVARQLVGLLNGTIGVESRVGKGSMFWFIIPLPESLETDDEPVDVEQLGLIFFTTPGPAVETFAARLRNLGFEVHLTHRAETIGAAVTSVSERVERLLILVGDRKIDAAEVASALRREVMLERVPLVLISGTHRRLSLPEKRQYVTSVGLDSTDLEVLRAIQIAQPKNDRAGRGSPKEHTPMSQHSLPSSRLRVLAADRSSSNRAVISRQIQIAGHSCVVVEDGEQAVSALAEEDFDLVLLDAELDKLDGFEAAQMIRFLGAGMEKLPVIGVVDKITPSMTLRSNEAGMQDLVARPVTAQQLATLFSSLITTEEHPKTDLVWVETSVEAIASHPRFKNGKGPPLSNRRLEHLGLAGKDDHLAAIREEFVAEAMKLIEAAQASIRYNNIREFHRNLQCIRSSATTLAAERLMLLCAEAEGLDASKLELSGRVLLSDVKAEVTRIGEDLSVKD